MTPAVDERPLRHARRRRLTRVVAVTGGVAFAALAIFAVLVYIVSDNASRTITVTARTEAASVTFAGPVEWSLPSAVVCRAAADIAAPGDATRDPPCGSAESRLAAGEMVVDWLPGATIVMRRTGRGPLEVLVSSDTLDLCLAGIDGRSPSQGEPLTGDGAGRLTALGNPQTLKGGDRIVVPENALDAVGVLGVLGTVAIGTDPAPGTRSLLLGGRYEMSETSHWSPDERFVVRDGELMGGDRAMIMTDHRGAAANAPPVPLCAEGFFWPSEADTRGFNATVTATGYNDMLSLRRTGHDATGVIRVQWSDRALVDPVFLALAAIVSFIGLMMTLVNECTAFFERCSRRTDH